MLRSRKLSLTVLAFVASLAFGSTAFAEWTHRATTRLFGPSPMKGHASYLERPRDGTMERRFKVEIQNAIPLTTFQVKVNGVSVGSITANSFGKGKLQLRTPQFIDSPGDGLPMPDDFPHLDTNDMVVVGKLSGSFFDRFDDSVQRYRLRGESGGNPDAKVDYRERFKNSGGLERRFKVEVEDASPGQQFTIIVRGKNFGTITANSFGRAELQLRTAAFIDSPGDGIPMPDTFPSLKIGEVVKIGSLNVTMQLDD